MEYCNGFPTLTKVKSPIVADKNDSEAKQDWPNSYASMKGMIVYLT